MILFSGHGETDEYGNFYFLPYDSSAKKNIRDAAISRHDIIDLLNQLPSTVILVLDACHSGAATTAVFRGPPMDAVNSGVRRDLAQRRPGTIIMAAKRNGNEQKNGPTGATEPSRWPFWRPLTGRGIRSGKSSDGLPQPWSGTARPALPRLRPGLSRATTRC